MRETTVFLLYTRRISKFKVTLADAGKFCAAILVTFWSKIGEMGAGMATVSFY